MNMRKALDISCYLVVGPENTLGRPVRDIVKEAVKAGFTCVQIRSKVASARELIEECRKAAEVIKEMGKSDSIVLLVDDRLDVALACRDMGIKVDGIHVGQSDIPPEICRKLLGPDAIVGLSAPTSQLIDYAAHYDTKYIDYFGAGPLHETASKPESGLLADGTRITRTFDELAELHRVSPVPIVVGGGVKSKDLPDLKKTGVGGFFCISAVAGAEKPYEAAREMVSLWKNCK
jgi:thiamine-phosphate diphosphorylase